MAEYPPIDLRTRCYFGGEPLSQYLEWAINNISSTHQQNGELYQQFLKIDDAFLTTFRNLAESNDMIFGLMLIRAHSSFRGACMLSMSAQSVDAYMLMRGCLEAALYSLHMEANPGLWEIWLNRYQHKEKCRSDFSYGKMRKTLKLKSEKHCNIMHTLYERTIDFGAHPNELTLTAGLRINKDADKGLMRLEYTAGDPSQVFHAWRTTSQIGVCALHIM
jgi:hypothetical protein